MMLTFVTALALARVTLAPVPQPSPTCAAIQVGDLASHVFATPLWNAMGTASLEDLRGRPVLIDFWGTRCPPCVGAAVPASLKLQETFGDDLQVIFVESQGLASTRALSFAVAQKWMGGRAQWTSEQPFDSGFSVLPGCVLLGNDGRVLLKGNPIQLHKEIERRIAEQIQAQKSPPPGAPASVAGAWAEFHKGRYAKAFELADQARVEFDGNAASLAAVTAASTAFHARIAARLARASWLLEHGYVDEAEAEIDLLAGALKGSHESEEALTKLRARLSAAPFVAEREAERQLSRLRTRFFESGGDPAVGLELEAFARKNPDTQAAARAQDLARLSAGAVSPR